LTVIPTITWAEDKSFDFCFEGIETGAVVAVSTVGNMDNTKEFMAGYLAMIKRIKPELVINYGQKIEGMDEAADILSIPYEFIRKEKET
jgi:hypothetical protein